MAKTKKVTKVTNEDLEKERKRKLGEKLTSLREDALERVTTSGAQALGIPYINLKGFPINKEALLLISEEESKAGKIIPFYEEDNILKIGIVDVTSCKTPSIL